MLVNKQILHRSCQTRFCPPTRLLRPCRR